MYLKEGAFYSAFGLLWNPESLAQQDIRYNNPVTPYKKAALASFFLYLATSLPGLFTDVLNTDGINWHTRSNKFVDALLSGKFENTYQSYHPGITLMWISGPPLHLYSRYLRNNGEVPYSYKTYLKLDYVAKLSVVSFTLVVFLYAQYLLYKTLGLKIAIIFSVLFILEPFVVGQRRLYHLDYLMTLLGLLSFALALNWRKNKQHFLITLQISLFLVLSILTKSTGILMAPVLLIVMLTAKVPLINKLKHCIWLVMTFALFVYVFVPAIWKNPVTETRKVFVDIYSGVIDIGFFGKREVGFAGTKRNVVLDEFDKNGGASYYLKSIFYNLSPLTSALACYVFVRLIVLTLKRKVTTEELLTTLAIVAFLIPMSISNKKGLRYGVVLLPYIILLQSFALATFRTRHLGFALSFYIITLLPQYLTIYPYFYSYANPILGGVKAKTALFKPGSLGVGTYELNKLISQDVGHVNRTYTISGFKSLKVINPPGFVDTSFKCQNDYIAVYALDKTPAERCADRFEHIGTVRVGNLDYWKLYKRM